MNKLLFIVWGIVFCGITYAISSLLIPTDWLFFAGWWAAILTIGSGLWLDHLLNQRKLKKQDKKWIMNH